MSDERKLVKVAVDDLAGFLSGRDIVEGTPLDEVCPEIKMKGIGLILHRGEDERWVTEEDIRGGAREGDTLVVVRMCGFIEPEEKEVSHV